MIVLSYAQTMSICIVIITFSSWSCCSFILVVVLTKLTIDVVSHFIASHRAIEVSLHHSGTLMTHVDPTCLERVAVTDGFVVLLLQSVLCVLTVMCEDEFRSHHCD